MYCNGNSRSRGRTRTAGAALALAVLAGLVAPGSAQAATSDDAEMNARLGVGGCVVFSKMPNTKELYVLCLVV